MDIDFGYDRDRFPHLKGDQFDCPICCSVAKNPKECSGCGSLFCDSCIKSWLKKSKACPNRCSANEKITDITSKALLRMYNNLEIKCSIENCNKIVQLSDIKSHEESCNKPKCVNHENCGNHVKKEFEKEGCCDMSCVLIKSLKNSNNPQDQYKLIKQFLNQNFAKAIPPAMGPPVPVGGAPVQNYQANNQVQNGQQKFFWSTVHKGNNIEVSGDKSSVWLKEQAYMFRSICADKPFYNGCHYWEIIADSRTENELKIGVATKLEFNYNSAFCDYEFGFSFYGLGQLRHGSNASGPQYGKRFKKEGVLGVFLNMNKGQLSFALNGEFMGVGFQHEALKKGPIYPCISLLHCAGCRLNTSRPIPPYFPM